MGCALSLLLLVVAVINLGVTLGLAAPGGLENMSGVAILVGLEVLIGPVVLGIPEVLTGPDVLGIGIPEVLIGPEVWTGPDVLMGSEVPDGSSVPGFVGISKPPDSDSELVFDLDVVIVVSYPVVFTNAVFGHELFLKSTNEMWFSESPGKVKLDPQTIAARST